MNVPLETAMQRLRSADPAGSDDVVAATNHLVARDILAAADKDDSSRSILPRRSRRRWHWALAAALLVATAVGTVVLATRQHQPTDARHHAPPQVTLLHFDTKVDGQHVTELMHVAVRSGHVVTVSVNVTIPSGVRMTELQILAAAPQWGLGPNGPFGPLQKIFDRNQPTTGTLTVLAKWTATRVAGVATVTLAAAYDAIDKNGSYEVGHTLVLLDIK